MNPGATSGAASAAETLAAQLQVFALAITASEEPVESAALFSATPQGDPPRLSIYRHAFRARLTAALRENYPVLHRVLGDQTFDEVALGFIAAHPSHHPSIRWFGNALPGHLQTLADAGELPHPALPDLARMEWALGTAFDAADAAPLSVEQLLAVAPEAWPELRFSAHPSLRLIALDWAIEPLWRALSDNPEAETAAPEAQPHHLLVWRQNDQTQWRSVEPFEATLLQAALAGESFAELCERAAATQGEQASATVAGHLRVWVETGLLTS
ncbi:MAG: putative DNA-binding domain-containing protein [Rhodocyclaceae bacterium]|nr:putative DNA-binding domain-containing protein [Rhodocyclaceae bacterium]